MTRRDRCEVRGARMRKRAKEGRCEGRKPYGFYEGEDKVIERMKALRADGLGYDRIAAQMNAEGIATLNPRPMAWLNGQPHIERAGTERRERTVVMAVYKRGKMWWYKFTWNGQSDSGKHQTDQQAGG